MCYYCCYYTSRGEQLVIYGAVSPAAGPSVEEESSGGNAGKFMPFREDEVFYQVLSAP